MSNQSKRVKTQWNHYVRPFDSFSESEINGLLGFCSETTKVAEELSGKQCFLAYGALLGYQRSGKLIPHDFDIDVAIACGKMSRDEVAETCRDLMEKFLDAGYEVKAKCFAQFFVLPPKGIKERYKVEFFASWVEEDKLYLYFALPGVDIVDDIFPLTEIELQGHQFNAPKVPEALLSATYGADWATPNPEFSYNMTGEKWRPFTSFFFNRNKKQWDEHYSNFEATPPHEELTVMFLDNDKLSSSCSILDIGGGLGHDALALASAGHKVTLIDTSEVAVQLLNDHVSSNNIENISAEVVNLYDVVESSSFSSRGNEKYDFIWSNNVVNFVSLVGQTVMFKLASSVIAKNGVLSIAIDDDAIAEDSSSVLEINPNANQNIPFYTRKVVLNDLVSAAENEEFAVQNITQVSSTNTTVISFIKINKPNVGSADLKVA